MTGMISAIVGGLLGIGIVYKYYSKVKVVLVEVYELLQAVINASKDDKWDEDELALIKKEALDIIPAIKDILKK